mgnify:CR=1 FL=1
MFVAEFYKIIMKPIIYLQKVKQRDAKQLAMQCSYDPELMQNVKELEARWSRSLRLWYLPYENGLYRKIIDAFRDLVWKDALALFEGQKPPEPKSKPLPPRSCRENGTNSGYIQQLLGHHNLNTNEIYLQVTKTEINLINSQLDD